MRLQIGGTTRANSIPTMSTVALNDRLFDRDSNMAVMAPLTAEAISRVETTFVEWVQSAESRPFRYRRGPRGRGWRRVPASELRDRALASIHHLPDGLDLAGMERAVRHDFARKFAVELFVSGDTVAFCIAHRFADGLVSLAVLRAVTGRIPMPTGAKPAALVRALRHSGQLSVRAIRAGRTWLRELDWVEKRQPRAEVGRTASDETIRLTQLTVSTPELSALTAIERAGLPEGQRLAPNEVLAGLVLRALRRCLAEEHDIPIVMTVGLRRFLPEGVDARANFAMTLTVGSLRGLDWSASEFRDVALPRARDPRAVAAAVVAQISGLRARLLGRLRSRRPAHGEPLCLFLNLLPGATGLAPDDFVAGADPRPTLIMVRRGAAGGPHCTIVAAGSVHVVSILDDTGLFDLDRFAEHLEAEKAAISARAAATA